MPMINARSIAQGTATQTWSGSTSLWAKEMPAYVRPLGEPNRCLNVYSAYDCSGKLRDAAHRPRWYRLASGGSTWSSTAVAAAKRSTSA